MILDRSIDTSANQPRPKPIALTELPGMLQDRGLLQAALKAGWLPHTLHKRSGWRFPVFDMLTERPYRHPVTEEIAYRWKNADMTQQGGPKYTWLFGQNGCPAFYVLPGTGAAIAQENGLCYIAAGEPDVLAYRSAGICNVISWLNGEGSVPEELAQIARQLGITAFYYLVDHDTTGEQSAHATRIALEGSNIIFNAYRLPDRVGDKGDINTLWIRCQFDPVRFTKELQRIQSDPKAIIQQSVDPVRSRRKVSPEERRVISEKNASLDWIAEHAEWVKCEVMPLLNQHAPVISREGNIERRLCPSPSHREENPSFRISYDKDADIGIPQCSCNIQNEHRPWDKVGEWVGATGFMDWFHERQYKKRVHSRNPSQILLPDQSLALITQQPPSQLVISSHQPALRTTLAFTDMGNAERLSILHGVNLRYVANRKLWLLWEGGYWRQDERGQIMEAAKDTARQIMAEVDPDMMSSDHFRHAKKSEEIARLKAMINLATSAPLIAILESDLDTHPLLFGCSNGIIDLRTGMLCEPHREDLITRISPIEYDYALFLQMQRQGVSALTEIAPHFNHFLNVITGDSKDYVAFLIRAFGYSLTGDTREEVFFILYGSGANGKTKLLELMAFIMGDHATKARFETFTRTTLDSKAGHNSDIARLSGARFVHANEGNEGSQLNVALINEITGGDTMTASFKYENEFEYRPNLKLWFATNHKPIIREGSIGIWRRLRLLPFTVIIPVAERDQHLLEKMQAEAPAILAALVYGCLQWQRLGLLIPQEVRTATAAFRSDQDTVQQFVDICCQLKTPAASIAASQLHACYYAYCHEQGIDHRAVGRSQFYERIEALPGVQRQTIHKQFHFTGIQLHSD